MFAGILGKTFGHWSEAERNLRSAIARDPLNSYAHFNLGEVLYLAGQYADAETVFRHLLELTPNFAWTRPYLAKTLLVEGKPQAALSVLEPIDENARNDFLSEVLWANHRELEADAALQRLISKFGGTNAYLVALNYAYRNDKEPAVQWLNRAYVQRDLGLLLMNNEPLLRNVVGDTRVQALRRKLNLPD